MSEARLVGDEREDGKSIERSRFRLTGLGLPRSLSDVRFRDVAVAIAVGLTLFAYIDVIPHGRIESGQIWRHKTDFTVFTEAGAAFFDGRDPYRVTNPRGWHYLYPPLFALLVAPLSVFDSASQVAVWYFVSSVLAFGCFGEARKLLQHLARECGPVASWSLLAWVAVCASLAALLPALDCLQRGQLGIALLYLLLLGARMALTGRAWPAWFAGGVVLALAVVVKLVPALPVGILVLQQVAAALVPATAGRPTLRAGTLAGGVVVGAILFVLVIPAAIIGWRKNLDSLDRWTSHVVANDSVGANSNFDIHSARNQSLANAVDLLRHASEEEWLRRLIRKSNSTSTSVRVENASVYAVIGVVLASLGVLAVTLGRRASVLDRATCFSLACWATILVSPLAWGHYYMVELPALICVPLWLARRGWVRAARVSAAVPAVLVWAHYCYLKKMGPLGVLGLGTTAWYLVVVGLIAGIEIARARRRSREATPAPGPHAARPTAAPVASHASA